MSFRAFVLPLLWAVVTELASLSVLLTCDPLGGSQDFLALLSHVDLSAIGLLLQLIDFLKDLFLLTYRLTVG